MDDKISVTLEPLEKIFQQVEEESERRAQEEEHDTFATQSISSSQFYAPSPRPSTPSAGNGILSSSESRGQGVDGEGVFRFRGLGRLVFSLFLTSADDYYKSSSGPPTPNLVSSIASHSPFFQAQIANSSTASFASVSTDHSHTEESNHITQVHQIAGRTSISRKVGNMIPRRLSRARSASVLSPKLSDPGAGLVIGVSVQEKTVEVEGEEEGTSVSVHTGASDGAGALRNQKSRMTIAGGEREREKGWIARARVFTARFRRKGKGRALVVRRCDRFFGGHFSLGLWVSEFF
ncbi:hypothetical protein BDQ17DRAFT_1420061 [Cyathus striatus]|nr:hypothetical protein BDQ17DRAFT_1420061 [Cyathus striatus]